MGLSAGERACLRRAARTRGPRTGRSALPTHATAPPTPSRTRSPPMYPPALQARRWAVILAALLSGTLVFISMLVDPVPDASGEALIRGYAAQPVLQGVHTNLIHYGYALFAPVAFALVGLVRGRGAWLANLAGLLAVLGLTTLPGLVVIDYHDVATANVAGVAVAAPPRRRRAASGVPARGRPGAARLGALAPAGGARRRRARLLPAWVPLALAPPSPGCRRCRRGWASACSPWRWPGWPTPSGGSRRPLVRRARRRRRPTHGARPGATRPDRGPARPARRAPRSGAGARPVAGGTGRRARPAQFTSPR